MHNTEELIELIAAELTLDEVMDVLGWDLHELLWNITDVVKDNADEFMKVV